MSRVRRLLSVAGLVAAGPLGAQQKTAVPSVFHVTPYVGYMVFGEYLKGPIGLNLSSTSSAVYGAQAALDVAPNVSLVGNLGVANSNLRIGLPIIGGVEVGSNKILLYDGNLHLSLPYQTRSKTSITPFVEGGIGAMRYTIENSLINTTTTNVAFNVGGGVDYALTPALGLRLMAKDYIGRFDLKEATSVDLEGRTAHNLALSAGVTFSF
jgi:opacity protein-like surface antigen